LPLDLAVDRGEVSLLRGTVEPGVDLDSLAEKSFQDWV
jgi:hypothetical protein